MILFRLLFAALACSLVLSGCATRPRMGADLPPIVFVHGNGDSAALWQTTVWRFESNGWPTERMHAIDLPFPLARDDDTRDQPGRSGTADAMAYLKSEVDAVLERTGSEQVILIGNSRGGNAIRNYIQNGGGEVKVSHAILAGTPNHGIWAVKGLRENSEFSGLSVFLRDLNTPKTATGDEVTPNVKWLTIRSDNNDKYAQPDGLWIGSRGLATNVTYASPELLGAENVVLPGVDHRETAFSPAAFEAMARFLTGQPPRTVDVVATDSVELGGRITGLGLRSADPASGNFANNLPVAGARIEVYEVDAETGERQGEAAHRQTVGDDGHWGPFTAKPGAAYEFVIAAAGYPINHVYRGPFPRGSDLIHFRLERAAASDRDARAVITLTRPRGYFDVERDRISFGGMSPPPGLPPKGAGVSTAKLVATTAEPQTVVAEFNGERVAGRTWPAAENRIVFVELTN
ncbi:MAG: alpha/beta fold hydrolase [Lautropia sp.]